MQCIYNDYEFDNRINKLAWTLSGNYNDEIDISEKNYKSKDISLYFAIISGARRNYIDWDIVKKYLLSRINIGYDRDSISNLVQVVLNNIVESRVKSERPGVKEIRKSAYKEILINFNKINQSNIFEKIKYVFVLESMGKHPSVDGFIRRIINDIKDIK